MLDLRWKASIVSVAVYQIVLTWCILDLANGRAANAYLPIVGAAVVLILVNIAARVKAQGRRTRR